ncbi:hypothetical protein [Mucilaginibacter xinganensis]|uniref:Uncharacterized protein n=1 Tax=Mucilaginibacter xinganensis TaxID=1234841 RepID=A0A223NXH1_9SPHI|nr:hypothetical protein [Mucilaginibacter xinganensis]ASU34394.1 hypothetical protein MuYL_2507 [Mucilaginibacter xinganensis]
MDKFTRGQYLVFRGETGARWNNGSVYIYLGNGVITDKNGDIKKPTWPNFIEDNFTVYQPVTYCTDFLQNC